MQETLTKRFVYFGLCVTLCFIAGCSYKFDTMKTDYHSLLENAIKKGETSKVEALLERTPSLLDELLDDNVTPLMLASINNQKDIVQLLVKKGASINAKSKGEYMSALSMACAPFRTIRGMEGGFPTLEGVPLPPDPALVKFLLDNGAEVNPSSGPPPLLQAVFAGSPEVCQLLIDRGAQVNIDYFDEPAHTLLAEARTRGNRVITDMLIKAGAR